MKPRFGIVLFQVRRALILILSQLGEGADNGSAAVLKAAGRKAMQVRVLSPPPFLSTTTATHKSPSVRYNSHLARFWRASDRRPRTKRQRSLIQRIDCRAEILWHRVSVTRSHLQSGVACPRSPCTRT